MSDPILIRAENLVKQHRQSSGFFARLFSGSHSLVRAVDGVSLALTRGRTLGLIGESGCGKSTLGRTLLMLHRPDAGRLVFDGIDLTAADARSLLGVRRRMQMIFQDPYSSLNPVHNVEEIIGLPLSVHDRLPRAHRREKVAAMMESVGLAPALMNRNPSQFSGGQRQRIGIARALILQPDFVVCDEPVSALDVSVQAQIIDLLKTLKNSLHLTYLFISHDLAIVASISDSIAVMYLGEIVELAPTEALIDAPRHPYTQILWSAIPRIGHKRTKQSLPVPGDIGVRSETGCHFSGRCPHAMDICRRVRPRHRVVGVEHQVACHLYE